MLKQDSNTLINIISKQFKEIIYMVVIKDERFLFIENQEKLINEDVLREVIGTLEDYKSDRVKSIGYMVIYCSNEDVADKCTTSYISAIFEPDLEAGTAEIMIDVKYVFPDHDIEDYLDEDDELDTDKFLDETDLERYDEEIKIQQIVNKILARVD